MLSAVVCLTNIWSKSSEYECLSTESNDNGENLF